MQSLNLVLVAAYQQILSLPYVDTLLLTLKREFAAVYQPGVFEYAHFNAVYQRALKQAEKRHMTSKQKLQSHQSGQVLQVGPALYTRLCRLLRCRMCVAHT